MPELQALTKYWRRSPPVHISVAAYLGISSTEPPDRSAQPDVRELEAIVGPALPKFRPPARMIH